jgi:MFS family permease
MLTFGFLMAAASTFGQTFFIGLFTPDIEATFNLSHSEWGTIYMIGTLLSAAALTFTGRWIDQVELRRYALMVCVFLGVACLGAALTPGAWFLVPMVFLLRQAGQGLASHVSITGMVKHFHRERGMAVAIAALGFPVGRALLPMLAVVSIAVLGWRVTYVGCALLVFLVLTPVIAMLLRHRGGEVGTDNAEAETAVSATPATGAGAVRSEKPSPERSLSQALREPAFYLLIPGVLAPAFFDTALSFHLLSVASLKSWSPEWVTSGYAAYSIASVVASMWLGSLVERCSTARLLSYSLLPYLAGMLVLGMYSDPIWAWVYLALFGVGSGARATLIPVLLSELYGTRHVGAIRSFVATLGVIASALGPLALGFALDLNASVWSMAAVAAGSFALSSALMAILARR